MIKILFFIPELSGGGAEKVLRNLVNNMDQTEFDITVQTVSEEKEPEKYLASGIRYKAINRCKSSLGKKLFNYWYRLCAELKMLYPLYIRDNYDIEIAYLECGATKAIAGSTNKRAVKLAWVHCDLAKKEGMAEAVEKLKKQYSAYDKVICVSESVKKSFIHMLGNHPETMVLYNVNDEDEIREKAEAFVVPKGPECHLLAVGRLTRQKGFDRLLEACSMLKREGFAFRLQILGEGPERVNLEKQIQENHLETCVQLMGFQSNPYPYIKAADLVVCSSRYEGLSTVAIESMILGTPVLTTPCSGMEELLGDSEYGLITEDSSEGLYTGLRTILEKTHLLNTYAGLVKVRGEEFTKNRTVQEIEDFFQELITNTEN